MVIKNNVNPDMLRLVFDKLPSLIFVVDDDLRIQAYNAAAAKFLSDQKAAVFKPRGDDEMTRPHSAEVLEGCESVLFCEDFLINNSITEALHGSRLVRRHTKLNIIIDGNKTELYVLITCFPFYNGTKQHALLMIEEISKIAELQGVLTICSVCHQVRDEKGIWSQIEGYFKKCLGVYFSHGFCPKCYKNEMTKIKRYTAPKPNASVGS